MDEPLKQADDTLAGTAIPSAPADAEILDHPALMHRIGGDLELLSEIIELFLADAPGLVADVSAALARNDTDSALRSAHRLRGAAAELSALRVAALATELESRGRQGQWEEAPAFCQALDAEIARLRPVLGAIVRKKAA